VVPWMAALAIAFSCGQQDFSKEVSELILRLGSEEFEKRESATRALTLLGTKAREPLEAAGKSPDAEIRVRAAAILEDILLAEKLVRWGETEGVFWTVYWELSQSDSERLSLVLEAAFPSEKSRAEIRRRKENAAEVMKALLEELNEWFYNDADRERFETLEKRVKAAGAALVPPLRHVLEYDMTTAFTQSEDGPVRNCLEPKDLRPGSSESALCGRVDFAEGTLGGRRATPRKPEPDGELPCPGGP